MTTVDRLANPPDAFVVVVNDRGQHALWRAGPDVPPGWERRSPSMSRSDCLAAVEGSWPDLAPVGLGDAPRPAWPWYAHERVAEQAVRRPSATAVLSGRARVTYGELGPSANQLAGYLAEAGAGPESVIGVHLERGVAWVRAVLAVMQAGACYLPLDPTLPPERLARICAQVRPAAVITATPVPFPDPETRLLALSELAPDLGRRPATAPAVRPDPDNLGYVIYTSGSTGDPKAVGVSFGSLAQVIGDLTAAYQVSPDDRVVQIASMAFDTSLEQVLTTLAAGATLVLPPARTVAPSELLRGIQRRGVTVIDLTPAYWHQLLALATPADERLRSLRLLITGGETADPADCRAALRAAPWARLLNAYGLTETAITSTLFDASGWRASAPEASVPVGHPVGPTRVMVLDERLNPVPAGAGGEVYIGGPGVARGYLGRPGLTAERFLPDAGGGPGARMYRTGDLGRWLEDGSLEVAGRVDRQLKVRGFRVEPGEIESVLAAHPDIGQVSVAASARGSGDTRLVAYYTARAGAARPPSATSLRRYLADRLPGYLIPAAFVPRQHLNAGPDGPAGPAPALAPVPATVTTGTEEETPVQAGLSALWARLLGQDRVALDDDFFALGGNSLLAAEMLAHTRAMLGISADALAPLTRRLLRDPTLRGFAGAATAAAAGELSPDGDQVATDFARDARLDVRIRPGTGPSLKPAEALLTGATGFLGAHLLRELLTGTEARVHCLVRARDEADAMSRLRQAAARYELPAPPAERVVPLVGDLAEPGLGLPDEVFRGLARRLDVIYHPGAQVNFIYPYQELRAANVTGTREVIRLAGLERGIPVHYVSTTAVLAGLGSAGTRAVTEETPLAHPEQLRMGYVETKYVAEELLRGAGRAGLPVAIYRPLDIVGSAATGAWSTATEMCALIRFIVDTGLAPDIDLLLDFVAADSCAAAIRHISRAEGATGRTYHLASSANAPLRVLTGRLRDRGYPVTEVPYAEWTGELARLAARDPSHPMAAFLPLFVSQGADGRTVAEMYFRDVFPRYTRANTVRALAGSGIVFPPVRGELLDRNLDRLIQTGYLPAPSAEPAHAR